MVDCNKQEYPGFILICDTLHCCSQPTEIQLTISLIVLPVAKQYGCIRTPTVLRTGGSSTNRLSNRSPPQSPIRTRSDQRARRAAELPSCHTPSHPDSCHTPSHPDRPATALSRTALGYVCAAQSARSPNATHLLGHGPQLGSSASVWQRLGLDGTHSCSFVLSAFFGLAFPEPSPRRGFDCLATHHPSCAALEVARYPTRTGSLSSEYFCCPYIFITSIAYKSALKPAYYVDQCLDRFQESSALYV